jgi:hypothetical protein
MAPTLGSRHALHDAMCRRTATNIAKANKQYMYRTLTLIGMLTSRFHRHLRPYRKIFLFIHSTIFSEITISFGIELGAKLHDQNAL